MQYYIFLTCIFLFIFFCRLKFIESGRDCFINSDMFYVEVTLCKQSVRVVFTGVLNMDDRRLKTAELCG